MSLWGSRANAVASALQAILVNRVGDVLLTMAIVASWVSLGSVDIGMQPGLGQTLLGVV